MVLNLIIMEKPFLFERKIFSLLIFRTKESNERAEQKKNQNQNKIRKLFLITISFRLYYQKWRINGFFFCFPCTKKERRKIPERGKERCSSETEWIGTFTRKRYNSLWGPHIQNENKYNLIGIKIIMKILVLTYIHTCIHNHSKAIARHANLTHIISYHTIPYHIIL